MTKTKFLKFVSRLFCNLFPKGSAPWLVMREQKYGGFISEVPRNKVSPKDPRPSEKIKKGGMKGGDRMLAHGYARKYAEYLRPFTQKTENIVLVECGILKGTGLAIWCDLFPKGNIIGLDIDLNHTLSNFDNLRSAGAFKRNKPKLQEFDQLENNNEMLGKLLSGSKIDVFIDDGLHSDASIITTLESATSHLSKDFVYIIEDNDRIHQLLKEKYPSLKIDHQGELTVLTPTR